MNRIRQYSLLLAALLLAPLAPSTARAATKGESLVYVGTYTNKQRSKGIYVYRLNASTGKVEDLGLAGELTSPSWVTVHPSGKYLYAVTESGRAGSVTAFSIDRSTGKLKSLNTVSAKGSGPCHLAVDHTGKTLVVANYNNGTIAAFPIHDDGSLGEAATAIQHTGKGPDPKRQEGPHAHCATVSKDNRFVLINDLGLDQVKIYKLDASKAQLTPNDPPYGKSPAASGPRHLAFHPSGKYAYVVNEMQSSTTAFAWDAARGSLTELQTISDLPGGKDVPGNSGSEIEMHPSGKFVYSSNRGHDSIAVFAVDGKTGKLKVVEYASTQGKTPRGFGIDPTGQFLIAGNQDSDSLVVFRIDQKTGKLTPTGQVFQVGMPVCVQFLALK